jgi:hypothetical protein
VESEKLRVDTVNKLMYADGTIFDSGYQSSNPLNAYADIAKVERIWNSVTDKELTNYTIEGNSIVTTESIDDNMYIEYYYADLTQVITTEIVNRNTNEIFTHDLSSGECKMAFYPYWELSRGDIIVISATVLYRNQLIQRSSKGVDKLPEIEVYKLNDIIIDENNIRYTINTDYILQGRHIRWIGSKPATGVNYSVRFSFKPAYIIFEDNPQPNNLENKQYPVMVLAKSWTKTTLDDVKRLFT